MNEAAEGSKTFTHATVMSCMFDVQVPKHGGGTYPGTMLNFMDLNGQNNTQKWAKSYIDDPRNVDIRNALLSLQANDPITIHKTKGNKYWNVTRIDKGHVAGEKSQAAGTTPGAVQQSASGGGFGNGLQRSKEQCIRGEAIQAACVLEAGEQKPADFNRVVKRAETIAKYITEGCPAPITTVENTPVVTQAVVSQNTGPAPIPDIPGSVVTQTAQANPVVQTNISPAQVNPVTAVVAEGFDDGFGG